MFSYVTRHFLLFSLCPHVTFYKSLMSLPTVFVKGHIRFLQLLKWPCHTSFFTHVEPYIACTEIGDSSQSLDFIGSFDNSKPELLFSGDLTKF